MADVDECRAALDRLAAHLAANADEVKDKLDLDRSIACRVTDLDIAFSGRLRHGELVDVVEADNPKAQITLSATGDDFIAMVDGKLDFVAALAARRVSVKANPFDLLKLRKLL